MSNLFGINLSISYKDALKYIREHGYLTKKDRLNLESACDWDKPSSLYLTPKDIEAGRVIEENKVQRFLNHKFKKS